MSLNPFADGLNNNYSTFIVKNNNARKTVKVMGVNIAPGNSYNLMSLEGVTEADIKVSLLKGVLKRKLSLGEISIIACDLDLETNNLTQSIFLKTNSVLPVAPLMISPLGNNQDDWPQIAQALQNNSSIILDPTKTYLCKTAWTAGQIPNNRTIYVNGATIISSLTPSVSTNQQSVFYFNAVIIGNYGALTEVPVIGSKQIKFVHDTAISAGSFVRWGNFTNNVDQLAKIISISVNGSGIYTATLDEVVKVTATVTNPITVWRGTYSAATTYAIGDAVISNSITYVSLTGSNTNNTPASSPANWSATVANVGEFTVPQNISIIGPGTITGSGDRPFEFGSGDRCLIDGVGGFNVGPGFTTACMSWDSCSRDSLMRKVFFDGGYGSGGTVAVWGFALESDKRCGYEYCVAKNVGQSPGDGGFHILAARNGFLSHCNAENCYDGLRVSSITAGDYSAGQYITVTDCSFEGNRHDGINLVDGVNFINFSGVQTNYNTRYGLYSFIGGGLNPEYVNLESLFAIGNGDSGILLGNASKITAGNLFVKSNGGFGIDIIGTSQLTAAVIDGYRNTLGTIRNNSSVAGVLNIGQIFTREELNATGQGHIQCRNGSRTFIGNGVHEDLTGSIAANGTIYFIDDASTFLKVNQAHAKIANVSFVSMVICGVSNVGAKCRADFGNAIAERSSGTSGAAFYAISHGEISLGQNSRTIGAWANGCYAVDSTDTIIIGPNVDTSSAGAQSPNGGPPSYNFGTVTLNGASNVDTLFAPIHANNNVNLTLKTVGGTQGLMPICTITAGSKFTVKGIALDTSIYNYKIT